MMWSRCVAPSWWFYPEQCQAGHPWRTRQGHRVLVALRLRGRAGRPAARPRPPDGAVRGAGLHGLRLILNGDELKIGSPALARWRAGARCRARRWRRAVCPARISTHIRNIHAKLQAGPGSLLGSTARGRAAAATGGGQTLGTGPPPPRGWGSPPPDRLLLAVAGSS